MSFLTCSVLLKSRKWEFSVLLASHYKSLIMSLLSKEAQGGTNKILKSVKILCTHVVTNSIDIESTFIMIYWECSVDKCINISIYCNSPSCHGYTCHIFLKRILELMQPALLPSFTFLWCVATPSRSILTNAVSIYFLNPYSAEFLKIY